MISACLAIMRTRVRVSGLIYKEPNMAAHACNLSGARGGGDRRWRQEDCWGFTDQLETVLLGKFQTRIEIPSTEKKMRLLPGQQQPRLCFACAYMRMCAHICHTHVHTLKHRESNNDQITGERNHSLESAWASLPLPFCPSQAHSG